MSFRLYTVDECAGGRGGYPAEWHETLKYEVREQAGHRCVRCLHFYRCGETPAEWSPCDDWCAHSGPYRVRDPDVPNDSWWEKGTDENAYAKKFARLGYEVEAKWRVLTVHHLDGNKANCRWWNLAALCQRCHLQIQGKVRMERRWPHEHSDWFKPYVAGYYALVYLGEDLDRAATEARLDQLLDLEHRQLGLEGAG